jgi:hypothetical protein
MTYTISHARSRTSTWYQLEPASDLETATRRAYQYALEQGGYICVNDAGGKTVFGTDPGELARSTKATGAA